MRRRGRRTKGFAMIDALVALAIAALTLTLLTSATWGLKLASDWRVSSESASATDWLLARRTLSAWASDLSNDGPRARGDAMIGTATTLRLQVRDRAAVEPYVGELQVTGSGDIGYVLTAARHDGLRDARVAVDQPRRSVLLMSSEPMRFVYLFRQENTAGTVWRYETGDGEVLPLAVGIEVSGARQVTVPVLNTISQTCLSALGAGALEGEQCAVR